MGSLRRMRRKGVCSWRCTQPNVGLWDRDLRTNQVYYSPEWKQQIGYSDEEIGNDFSEWRQRVHPDDLARGRTDGASLCCW